MTDEALLKRIKDYPDFPARGVVFRDISPLLADAKAFASAVNKLSEAAEAMPSFDKIVAIDARGFIFGTALAQRLGKGMIMCRKAGKLPGRVVKISYGYEYSTDSVSIQQAAIKSGERLLIVDDVLASGNTLLATYKLVKKLGGEVTGVLCLLELSYLNGRELLDGGVKNTPVRTVLKIQK